MVSGQFKNLVGCLAVQNVVFVVNFFFNFVYDVFDCLTFLSCYIFASYSTLYLFYRERVLEVISCFMPLLAFSC